MTPLARRERERERERESIFEEHSKIKFIHSWREAKVRKKGKKKKKHRNKKASLVWGFCKKQNCYFLITYLKNTIFLKII